MRHLELDAPGAHAKGDDWPTCGCCGTDGLSYDDSFCRACSDADCGEQERGAPCIVAESERNAENERKARLYDDAISSLRNAMADFDALWSARKTVGDVYFARPAGFSETNPAEYKAELEAYEAAARAVRDETFRVVGAVEAVLIRAGVRK